MGLTQMVNSPTRFPDNCHGTPSLIDLAMTTEPDVFSNCCVCMPIGNSDHAPIELFFNPDALNNPVQIGANEGLPEIPYNLKLISDWTTIKNELSHANWTTFYAIGDVNKCYDEFLSIISDICCRFAPRRKRRAREQRNKNKHLPFVTDEFRRLSILAALTIFLTV
jgi:hypothetical protein